VSGLAEELLIALLSPEQASNQDTGAIHGEQSAYTVKFRSEDFEDDEGEGELA